jgi:hypothetical protein
MMTKTKVNSFKKKSKQKVKLGWTEFPRIEFISVHPPLQLHLLLAAWTSISRPYIVVFPCPKPCRSRQ